MFDHSYEVHATIVSLVASFWAIHHCSLQGLQLGMIDDDFFPPVVDIVAFMVTKAGQNG